MLSDQPSGDLTADRVADLVAELDVVRAELALARRQHEAAAEAHAESEQRLRDLRKRAHALASGVDRHLDAPGPTARLAPKVRRVLNRPDTEAEQVALLRSSELFDGPWYLLQHPGVVQSSLDAARHYLRQGAAKKWDPSPRFSTRTFLHENPDVAASGENPLVVHLKRGGDAEDHPTGDASPA